MFLTVVHVIGFGCFYYSEPSFTCTLCTSEHDANESSFSALLANVGLSEALIEEWERHGGRKRGSCGGCTPVHTKGDGTEHIAG